MISQHTRAQCDTAELLSLWTMRREWLAAFGTGGLPDEPALMEGVWLSGTELTSELDINLGHVLDKSLAVLNPLHKFSPNHAKDAHMMDDTDLAGPLLFCFVFGMLLLVVSCRCGACVLTGRTASRSLAMFTASR